MRRRIGPCAWRFTRGGDRGEVRHGRKVSGRYAVEPQVTENTRQVCTQLNGGGLEYRAAVVAVAGVCQSFKLRLASKFLRVRRLVNRRRNNATCHKSGEQDNR